MELRPIGGVYSSFKRIEDVPRDYGSTVGEIEVFEEYKPRIKDIDGISHLVILWLFHKSKGYSLQVKPLRHRGVRRVFATRHQNRPNPIGFTVVELLGRKENILKVKGVGMIDGTPVVDIKPYASADHKENIILGWIEKIRSGGPRS